MKNLIDSDFTLLELIEALRDRPPLVAAAESSEWMAVRQRPLVKDLFRPILAQARRDLACRFPVLNEELYSDFERTGRRISFEKVYFSRRRILGRSALCALLDDDSERPLSTQALVGHLSAILSEDSWALPAHVRTLPGRSPGHDPDNVDLFTAETANLVAELAVIFRQYLPESIVVSIKARLRKSIFENYLNNPAGMGWVDNTSNWNAVCHQGVIGAALTIEDDTDLVAKLVAAASLYLRHFLSGFGNDGGCSEGAGYWQYGFGRFAVLNEQLETATRGSLSFIEGSRHVREIAQFYTRVSFANNYVVNFADGSSKSIPNPALFCYLGKRLSLDDLTNFGLDAYRRLAESRIDPDDHSSSYIFLSRLFRDCPTHLPAVKTPSQCDHYFRGLDVLIVRRSDRAGRLWELAAKGGNNAEHHNHNDCGSYIVDIDGAPLIIEIGAPKYTKEFFREGRYENLAARTLGHSLPIVNGCEQAAGNEYAAVVVSRESSAESIDFVADLTKCYPVDAMVTKLIRSLRLDLAASTLTVTEEFELLDARSYETAVITGKTVQRRESAVRILFGSCAMHLTPNPSSAISRVAKHRYSDHEGNDAAINRIVFVPTVLRNKGSIGYTLSLAPVRNSVQQ